MSDGKKKLILVDGSNYIYRAYYALRPLSTSSGFPTNALYGFTRMLLKIIREKKPDYLAVVFDCQEPTFRDKEYAQYKANRKAPPDDLVQQFPHFERIIEAFSVSMIKKPGFEADDVIATIVKNEAAKDIEILMLSGDKDLMQLIDDNVKMLDDMRDKLLGRDDVVDRLGVLPEQVVDLLSLCGDSSDNIPGVKGIGIKTAAKLLSEYKTFDGIFSNAGKMKGVLGERIKNGKEMALFSKRLVKLSEDVPLEYDLKDLALRQFDPEKIRPILKEFEFSKLLSEITSHKGIDFSKYRLIVSTEDLRAFLKSVKERGVLSIDLETTSLNVMKADVVGISLSSEEGRAVYIPVGHRSGEQLGLNSVLNELGDVLRDEGVKKVGQNLNYDLSILRRLGVEIKGVHFDTMIAAYLLNPSGEHNLDALSELYLDHHTIRYEEVVGRSGKKQLSFADVDMERARDYSCEDADVALRLFYIFSDSLKEERLNELYTEIENPLIDVLVKMQLNGMKVDEEGLRSLKKEFIGRLKELEEGIFKLSDCEFNLNSPGQLGEVLFMKLKLPGGRRTKTGYSTEQSVLEKLSLEHEIAKKLLEYRSLVKLKHTYVESLLEAIDPRTHRIHTSFNQAGTSTGRLSSSNPNLQNIPARTEEGRKIRACFIAEKGFCLVCVDYSQIELRILAHISKDEGLVQAFLDGLDVHSITASKIFGVRVGQVSDEQRNVGKTINFSVLYGQTPFGLSEQLKIAPSEAKKYIDNYFKRYPKVSGLRDKVIEDCRSTQVVRTMFGRRRFIPDINSKNQNIVQAAQRVAFNTIFQGSAADIMKKAMIAVDRELCKISHETKMIMQVHDELVLEVPDEDVIRVSEFVKEKMENIVRLSVPLVANVESGQSWS